MNTATIQVRIDAKVKKDAQTVFESMGLDLSSGVKLYLTPRTVNGFTPAYEARLVREAASAKKKGTSYRSAKAAVRDVLA